MDARVSIAATRAVMSQDRFGRFISEIESAGDGLVKDFTEKMARTARTLAPSRTGRLRAGIHPVMFSSREGRVVSMAKHTMPIEEGARAHTMIGNVSFFWTREMRRWNPGPNVIRHPGNRSQPFLQPAFDLHWPTIRGEMKRRYPG